MKGYGLIFGARRQQAGGCGRLTAVFACLVSLLSFLGISASLAQAAPMGIVGFWGNPTGVSGTLGGEFNNPRGVAVNNTTGDVYVAGSGNNRIQMFNADGVFQWAVGRDVVSPGGVGDTNEKQTVIVGGGAIGGSFTLSFGANTTAGIAFDAIAAEVDPALEAIASVGAGNIAVTGGAGGPYTAEFTGTKTSLDLAQMTASAAGLTPSGTVGVATTQDGASFEICIVAAQCKAGTISNGVGGVTGLGNGGTFNVPQGIAINQATGDFYVSD